MKAYKNIFIVLVIGIAILAQLMNPTLARADGEPPPLPTDSVTEVVPPELPIATEPPTEAVPTEPPVATETPADAEIIPGSDTSTAPPVEPGVSTIEEPTLLEVTQEFPEGTDVVVLDETSQAVPLAMQVAAEIIAESDPVWCPAGQNPTPGANGCTASYATLGDLLADAVAIAYIDAQTVNGTIWISSGAIADTNAVWIDGLTYTNWANYSLTLQGGWNNTPAGTISGTSVFSVPISIINWNNNVTINAITINGAASGGLFVDTTKNIKLHNVTSSGNSGYGAFLHNGTGSVTLTGTNIFSNNVPCFSPPCPGTSGLIVLSSGNITLNNITASGNLGVGAYLQGTNVTLTGTNVFNNNFCSVAPGCPYPTGGLQISATGNITLNNITAESNYSGAYLDNSLGIGNVTLTGTNVFNNNLYSGLAVISGGNINLKNVTANGTVDGRGAFLYNIDSSGNVTLTGTNFFTDNWTGGLDVYSNGDITLNNVTAGNSGALTSSAVSLFNTCGGNVTINNSHFYQSYFGLYGGSISTAVYDNILSNNTFTGNNYDILWNYCPDQKQDVILDASTINTQGVGEFALNCAGVDGFAVNLPNGDLVNIYCPVKGEASIDRIDNTTLPADLPTGYSYASAFSLDILQGGKPIPVITEGGYITASFVAQPLQAGNTYSVLYWDNGTWIPIKDFMLDENNQPQVFDLFPGVPGDTRKIIRGVNLVTNRGSSRVEISTNFPGIFVLVQQ